MTSCRDGAFDTRIECVTCVTDVVQLPNMVWRLPMTVDTFPMDLAHYRRRPLLVLDLLNRIGMQCPQQ